MTEEKFFIKVNESAEKKFYSKVQNYTEENFDSLLEQNFSDSNIKEGTVIDGKVTSVGANFVLVNVGLKSEGKIPVQQFADISSIKVGSVVQAYVERSQSRDGSISLSHTKALRHDAWQQLYSIWSEGREEDVEGVILNTIKGGCIVDLDGLSAFLPNNHLDVKAIGDPASLIGIKLKFRILKMEISTGKIFVSRKKALGAAYKSAKSDYIANLKEGIVIDGKIKSVANYGAFVQIYESEETGAIDGLLYINDISWARVSHPSSVYSIGQEVKVKVIGVDKEKERISLGVKQLTENPWKGVSKKYIAGNIYEGVVTALEDYGVFVKLEDGVEGLVHNGEMSWTKDKPLLLPGQKIKIMLLSVDEDNHKMALSVRRCGENPWQKFLDQTGLGSVIKCKVKEIIDGGIVVIPCNQEFADIKGYVRAHNICWGQSSSKKRDIKDFEVNEEIKAKLMHVNTERGRVIFSIKHVEYDPFDEFLGSVKNGDKIAANILRVEDDGVYIEVRDRLEFFAPQSDVSSFTVGQERSFLVKNKEKYSIDLEVESTNTTEEPGSDNVSDDG